MKKKSLFFLAILCQLMIYANNRTTKSIYIDSSISELSVPTENSNIQTYHLFSHGKSGELFIDNQWMNVSEIALKFKNQLNEKTELYIYGCNFAQGEKGIAAVKYLEKTLNVKVSASTNITGIDGDWNLEIGSGKNELKLPNFKGNLQLDMEHYLNPMIAGKYSDDSTITEEYIYLSTPSATDITVQMNYASGTGFPIVRVTTLVTGGTTVTNNTGSFTFKNSTPVRLQFVASTTGNPVILPGSSPITRPLNSAGTIISGSTAGLKFTSTGNFYVNYRARSTPQAGSVLTKGTAALGTEFRWGGSPIEFATTIPETGNMLSIMATDANTDIRIDNIKAGTKFINGAGGLAPTPLVGPFNITLQKGQSFILYAPAANNILSSQDTGWLGAKIFATKNIAVTVGGLMQQGNASNDRDLGFDQLVPVNRLGLEHIVMQGNGGAREKVIVVSTVANTKVYVNNNTTTSFATLANAGDYTIIPSTSFNSSKNMRVEVSSPAYVFLKIYGSDANNTNSLMFIPPLNCFGEKSVDLIPDATKIGNFEYTSTQLVVLAATIGNPAVAVPPVVKQNGTVLNYTGTIGDVTGNLNWKSYRYNLSGLSNVSVTSQGAIQAEIFGANANAGFGGYYSGFGDAPSYVISESDTFGFLCPGNGILSVATSSGTYQWYKNNNPISGATTNVYSVPATDPANTTYYVKITFPGGCVISSNQVTSEVCPCTKPGVGGTPDAFTKMGISIRDKRTTADWPKDIPNGFIAMEANNKGFVITRIASPETAIMSPVIGMLVYDTTKDCLRLYNGTSWNCIEPTCN